MRWIVLLIPLCCLACEQVRRLGSECPKFEGPCPRLGDGSDDERDGESHADAAHSDGSVQPGDAGTRQDAGANDAEPPGAGPDASPADAASDAPMALFPAIRNGSFDLPPGASAPLKLDPLGSGYDDWYPCRAGMSIVSEETTDSGTIGPTDPATFFKDELNAISVVPADKVQGGLMQQLIEPMRAGQLYALEVDVRTNPGTFTGEITLQLGTGLLAPSAGPFSCLLSSFTELTSTGPIPAGAWITHCLSFTPQQDSTSIALLGSAPGNLFGVSGARLFVDNIRAVARCP
jgi:hypothetical protein